MKKNLKIQLLSVFAILLMAVSVNPLFAQTPSFEGDWKGALEVQPGTSLNLVMHLKAGEPWTGTIDSPDQGATGLAINSVSVDGNTLKLEIEVLGLTFEGTLEGDKIVGNFKQGEVSIPATFVREGNAAAEPKKEAEPQGEPVPQEVPES